MNKNVRDYIFDIIPKEYSWKILLLENWGNIVGDLQKSITIEQIEEDVLFLGVVHPAWAQELLILAPMLKQKINAFLNKEYVKTIRIKLKKTKTQNIFTQKFKPSDKNIEPAPLTVRELNMLSKLNDTELRDAMQAFYLKCKRHKTN